MRTRDACPRSARGNDLRRTATADGFAHESATARQQMLNGRGRVVTADGCGHPVAGDREGAGFGLMSEASGKLGGHFAHRRREHIGTALLYNHAPRCQATGGMGLKLFLERLAPTVAVEHDGCPSVGKP
jgi:hypothetical protein